MPAPDLFRALGDAFHVGWRDVLDVGVVGWLAYRLLRLVRGARAVQLVVALLAFAIAYGVAWALELTLLGTLLAAAVRYLPFIALVAFQPELRATVLHLTQPRTTRLVRALEEDEVVDEIGDAVERLSRSSTGAIVALERDVSLGDVLDTGTALNAKVSGDLLATIFTPYSPLHDGAVVVRGDTIVGAGCILPLSQARVEDRSLGTRHRAALGLSEESDALVVVVSEETGSVSLAVDGRLRRALQPAELRELLRGRGGRTSEFANIPLAG